jgi:hypothetical protein
MPPPPAAPGPDARTSAQVNAAIRALLTPRWGRGLPPDERVEYERLLAEWTAAVRAERAGRDYVRAA